MSASGVPMSRPVVFAMPSPRFAMPVSDSRCISAIYKQVFPRGRMIGLHAAETVHPASWCWISQAVFRDTVCVLGNHMLHLSQAITHRICCMQSCTACDPSILRNHALHMSHLSQAITHRMCAICLRQSQTACVLSMTISRVCQQQALRLLCMCGRNRHVPLGKVAHCLAATLATLASDPAVAQLAMQPTSSIVYALLQLISTSDDGAFAGQLASLSALACERHYSCHFTGAAHQHQ